MKKYDTLKQLQENYLVAVVRGYEFEDTFKMIDAIVEGGIKSIEITYTTPRASEIINYFSENSELNVGAGTVLSSGTADEAIRSGAKYIVSPHFDSSIAEICNIAHIPYLPGCATTTEIVNAYKFGLDVIKIFPGGSLGSKFIKDVKGPIPHANMMPSGGVSKENLSDWIESGAFAVGIGSALVKGYDGSNINIITQNTQEFVEVYNKSMKGNR